MSNAIIPIFFACDDDFAKFTEVSIYSLLQNASPRYTYRIHILHSKMNDLVCNKIKKLENENCKIIFADVEEHLKLIKSALPLRDYYSKTTYYRFFISEMFPYIDKAIYIDSDTVVRGDISELYVIDLADNYVGACHEQVMIQDEVFGEYAEKVVGVDRYNFFNAGVLLMNLRMFREKRVLSKFINLLGIYNFAVTQDEDYLNLILKDHVLWLDQRWNTELYGNIPYPIEEANIIHYIMTNKPWHYKDCQHSDIFFEYAKKTEEYDAIVEILDSYTNQDKEKDRISAENLKSLALSEIKKEDNFLNICNKKYRSISRVDVLKKIEEYERLGKFDLDVEEDPPSKELLPNKINYQRHGLIKRIKSFIAFKSAHKFVNKLKKENQFIIKGINGIENLNSLNSGAIVTANHFNAFDSFAMQIAYESSTQKKRRFYRVIREGNYTSFKGFYGFLMRNCNTLPLSSNRYTMKKFMVAIEKLLGQGHLILVYPEQSMWWNYRKPKPLKMGAYQFANNADVPILPCFITMKDSGTKDCDGFFVQEYTIHIEKPIYPDKNLDYRQRAVDMMEKNAAVWKKIYESEYNIPLYYKTNH